MVAKTPDCFVIMPMSDPDGYPSGHFARIYEDIFVPAIERAHFKAVRADQVKATNLIHLDVLQKLIDAPMALCDLSTLNPNVMFELGLRQASGKPVVLAQEIGTRLIFDIAPLRYAEYRRNRIYDEVLEDQKTIGKAIAETAADRIGVNSLVQLLPFTRTLAPARRRAAAAKRLPLRSREAHRLRQF